MESSIVNRFKTMVGGDHHGVADLEKWDPNDVEASLAKLEKGYAALQESLERINAAKERIQAEGGASGKLDELKAHIERLKENEADLEPQIELLQRVEKEPDAIADSPQERDRLREVLDGTPMEMHRVGHSIYLVDEWFYERKPGDKVDRRKEIEAVLEHIRSGSMRSRN